MSLKARLSAVSHTVTEDDGQGGQIQRDISLEGRYVATVEYFDDGAPQTVLHEASFNFPFDIDANQAITKITEYGQRIRNTRLRVNELTGSIGAVIDI